MLRGAGEPRMIILILYAVMMFTTAVGLMTFLRLTVDTSNRRQFDTDDIVFFSLIGAIFWPLTLPAVAAYALSNWLVEIFKEE